MSRYTAKKVLAGLLLPIIAVCGCSSAERPELGYVHGRVTLDGNPLPNAIVRFQPIENGRPAIATTDDNGYYVLNYTNDASGAVLGKHIVRISTGLPDDGDLQSAVEEKVPRKYNRDAATTPQMQVEIVAGNNELNFDLDSQGPIAEVNRQWESRPFLRR